MRDKTAMRYGNLISTFMKTLGHPDLVIVVARAVEIQKMETEGGVLFLLRRAKYIAENALFEAASPNDQHDAKEIAAH